MAALDRDRNTQRREIGVYEFTLLLGAVVHRGALVAIDADGLAVPASATAGLIVVGRADTGTADAAIQAATAQGRWPAGIVQAAPPATVRVRRGEFAYANAVGADALGAGDWGKPCFVVDDQTVAKSSGGGTRPQAGIFRGVDQVGAWVEI